MSQREMTKKQLALYRRANAFAAHWADNPTALNYTQIHVMYVYLCVVHDKRFADYLLGDIVKR